jgi:hypothetical protein
MTAGKASSGSTTIVGGRPMRRAVEVSDLPQGVERVLTLAALNHRFRTDVLRDPVAAAGSKGIVLDTVEIALLQAARPEQLAAMAERMVIPKSPDRRTFVKAVSASAIAMVTGKAIMLCSGCTTGIDTWNQDAATSPGGDASDRDAPVQQWMELNGYTCYLYLPRRLADLSAYEHSVMIALHGEDETCLASVQRWGTAADVHGFAIIAVSWTDVATTSTSKSQLARDLSGILQAYRARFTYHSSHSATLTSRGASTAIAFQAACCESSNTVWTSAAFLGGVPDGDWVNDPDTAIASLQVSVPNFLYYLRGDADPEYAQATACIMALRNRGVSLDAPTISGSLSNAVLDFSSICTYLRI